MVTFVLGGGFNNFGNAPNPNDLNFTGVTVPRDQFNLHPAPTPAVHPDQNPFIGGNVGDADFGINPEGGRDPLDGQFEGVQNTRMFLFEPKPRPTPWLPSAPDPEDISGNKLPKPDYEDPLDPGSLSAVKVPDEEKLNSDPESDDMNPLDHHFLWDHKVPDKERFYSDPESDHMNPLDPDSLWGVKAPDENKPFIVEPEIEEPEFVEFKKPKIEPKEVPLD